MVNKQSSSQVRYMKKFAKGLVRFLITMVIVTVFIIGIQIVRQGMWLWGLPDLDEIQSVSIAYPAVTNQVKEVSSKELETVPAAAMFPLVPFVAEYTHHNKIAVLVIVVIGLFQNSFLLEADFFVEFQSIGI